MLTYDRSMAMKVLKKFKAKVNFLYSKNKYLTPILKWLLCNALTRPHFDYGCTMRFSLLNKNLKHEPWMVQNKCMSHCLDLPPSFHIGAANFGKMNCF